MDLWTVAGKLNKIPKTPNIQTNNQSNHEWSFDIQETDWWQKGSFQVIRSETPASHMVHGPGQGMQQCQGSIDENYIPP